MNNDLNRESKRGNRVASFLVILFVLTLGIGIGTLVTYRAGAVGPGDSQLKIHTGAKPLVGQEVLNLSRAFEAVARAVEPAVVNINTEEVIRISRNMRPEDDPFGMFRRFMPDMPQQFRRQSLGSGVIVDPKGYIITNSHVVQRATKIKVNLDSGDEYMARVIFADELSDIAVIKIDGSKDFPTARIGDSKAMKVGEWVIAIGSPFGVEQTVTAGIISATGRVFHPDPNEPVFAQVLFNDFLQTDASINPGNSGGPLVNLNGEVVGINSFIQSATGTSSGVGFSIPSHIFVNIYNQILDKGKVERGLIGVNMNLLPFTPAMAKFFGVKQGSGVLITGMAAEDGTASDTAGPAAKAGIKAEDVIVEFDGKPVYDVPDLRMAVANTPPGRKVKVKAVRFGQEKSFDLEVAERTIDSRPPDRGTLSFEEGEKPKTEIGLEFNDLPRDLAQELKISGGALVTSVKPGSLAEDAGLQGQGRGTYDVIVAANGMKIDSAMELLGVVKGLKPEEAVVVKFLRVQVGPNRSFTISTQYTSFAKP